MMPRYLHMILGLLLLPLGAMAQTSPDTYWVQFTDKQNTPYSLDQPQQFLSPRAIQRRQDQGIPLDELDLPVDPAYISTVLAQGAVQLHNRSKWFNAITIRTTDAVALAQIAQLPFVVQVRSTRTPGEVRLVPDKFPAAEGAARELDYGAAYNQVSMMNGHLLHELAQGEGLLIGVLDSGFGDADWIPAFAPLHARNGVLLTRDLVDLDDEVYQEHWHGRSVLGCMAALVEGELVGTAPMADYVLLRTEDADSEYIVEEDNWVAGAELCDSLGCDVLNTSLGYTRFDDPAQDHTYADMDGNTTRISIAAGIAAQKGMIPVTSAGNSGGNEWFHISAPADAHDILAVGAVGNEGQYAPFSSQGPSADGRVKPDVAAVGWGTAGIGFDGVSVTGINGTSFSGPLVAGLVACLWQLHPLRTAQEVMDAVRRSASQYSTPDTELGYGIPDFMLAHEILLASTGVPAHTLNGLHIFPIPFADHLELVLEHGGVVDLVLLDQLGRVVWSRAGMAHSGRIVLSGSGLERLSSGSYMLHVRQGAEVHVRQLLKQ
jgi:serine protease AprX